MSDNRVYDTSQVKAYMNCPFFYYCKYVAGIRLIGVERSEYDMQFGQRVHAGLEKYYLYLKNKGNEQLQLGALWTDYQCPENEISKTAEGGKLLLKDYFKRWHDIDKDMTVHDAERVRTIDIGDHKFIVKLDTEVENRENFYSLEHKTTTSIRMGYFDRYFMDCQITAQATAIKELYGSCSGVMLNAMSVKYYQRKYKDRGVGFHTEFQRSIINRTPMEIEDWKIQMASWIGEIERDKERNFFRRSCKDTSCSSFNRVCQYANICKSSKGMEVDEQIVETMYEFVDPYEYLNETLETERSRQNEVLPSE